MQDAADSSTHAILHYLSYSAQLIAGDWSHVTTGHWAWKGTGVCNSHAEAGIKARS